MVEISTGELYILRMLFDDVKAKEQGLLLARVARETYFLELQKKYGDGHNVSVDITNGAVTLLDTPEPGAEQKTKRGRTKKTEKDS